MQQAMRIARDGAPITSAEWQALAGSDPELQHDAHGHWSWAGPEWLADAARWGWQEPRYHGFRWQDGAIHFATPEPCVIRKAWHMAQALGARVLDEAGDEYHQDGRTHLARAVDALTVVENAETLRLLLAQPWVKALEADKRWHLPLAECIVKLQERERAALRLPWFFRLFRPGLPPRR